MNIDDVLENERQAYRVLFTYLGINLDDVLATDIYLKQRFDLLKGETFYVLSFKVFRYDADGYVYADKTYDDLAAHEDISLRVPFDTIEEWREEFDL